MHQQSQFIQVTEDTVGSARKKLMERQFTINKALVLNLDFKLYHSNDLFQLCVRWIDYFYY